MKNTLIASVMALVMPLSASPVLAERWSDKPGGAVYDLPDGGRIHIASGPGMEKQMQQVENYLKSVKTHKVAQAFGGYGPQTQYHPPSFFQGAGGPVVVPPTVITTPGSVPRECRRKRITLALFFEVDSSDC